MTANNKTKMIADLNNKRLVVHREFAAPVEEVWEAWTEAEILDQWWAPKPWKAITKHMDFSEGGHWLICLNGPNGEQQWGKTSYDRIDPHEGYSGTYVLCDENGKINPKLPGTRLSVAFTCKGNTTVVVVESIYLSEVELEKVIAVGVPDGMASAFTNLDKMLAELLLV